MASVNKVILVGRCGRDPELRRLPSGQAVASVSVATSTNRKDRHTGETVEDTQWHRVSFYDRLAEIARDYLRKRRLVFVEGRLKYGKYVDQAGFERMTVDIVASELQLLGARDERAGVPDQGVAVHRPLPAPAAGPAAPTPAAALDDPDFDIPF